MLTPYRRHMNNCVHNRKGQRFSLCQCPLWVYGKLPSGRTVRRSLRTADWARALRRIQIIEQGGDDCFSPDSGITFADAIKAYLEDAKARKLSESTLALYGYLFAHLRRFVGAAATLRAIDTVLLDRFRRSRIRNMADGSSTPIEPSTQRKEIGLLRAFFSWCVDRTWIASNPARRVRLPQVTKIATLPFERDEVVRLLWACDRLASDDQAETDYVRKRARALVCTLLYSGLRISDVTQLRRSALDTRSGHLTLRIMKTGTPLKVLLHQDAVRSLESLPAINADYFFWSGIGKKITCTKNLARTIGRLGALVGVSARPHRFRDTFAVELLSNGADIRTVQLLLGHESVRTTEKHYAHFIKAHQEILDQASATLDFSRSVTTGPLVMKPMKYRLRDAK